MCDNTKLRLRGLPWSATKAEIVDFFAPIPLDGGEDGVEIVIGHNGRPSGEAYVTLANPDDFSEAEKKHNEHIGSRYVEVFPVREGELDRKRGDGDGGSDCVMRLRGLPYRCSKEEILQFFDGLEIVPNGIVLPTDEQGRHTGDAYVQFVDKDTADRSQDRHKEKIGHRYIEIFKSSELEMRKSMGGFRESRYMPPMGGFSRPSPYDSRDRFGGPNRYGGSRGGRYDDYDSYGGNSGGGYSDNWGGRSGGRAGGGGGGRRERGAHSVHMRGLPFKATDDDIADFFRPVVPVDCTFVEDNSGRPSGEADVEFSSHEDAVRAMSKDKLNMGHRYIELFLNSSPSGGGGGAMGGASGYRENMGGGGGGGYRRY